MAKSLLLILAVALVAASCLLAVDAGGDFGSEMGWLAAARSGGCDGTIGGCGLDGEFEMDSEISRRILATSRYISYAALNKNAVPCSRRGASYYYCRPGASANPYRRGCSAITRCRRKCVDRKCVVLLLWGLMLRLAIGSWFFVDSTQLCNVLLPF